MAQVSDVADIEQALNALAARQEGPFVVKLPREPGRRESRYAHLFSGEVTATAASVIATEPEQETPSPGGTSLLDRVARLEEEVAELRRAIEKTTPS